MDAPELYAIQAAKAQVSLEVVAFRRELDSLALEKESFLQGREKEAQQAVTAVMESAQKLLSEAADAAKEVNVYTRALQEAFKTLSEGRKDFRAWKETEERRLHAFEEEVQVRSKEMAKEAEKLAFERMKLNGAARELDLVSEQARKDLALAQEERRKLMENKKFMDEYAKGSKHN